MYKQGTVIWELQPRIFFKARLGLQLLEVLVASYSLETCPLVTVMRENGHFLLSLNKIVSLFPKKKKSVELLLRLLPFFVLLKHPFKSVDMATLQSRILMVD